MNNYPTIDQVEHAEKSELAFWYRTLPEPVNSDQLQIINRVTERLKEMGHWTNVKRRN
jgi:hypothetical protein